MREDGGRGEGEEGGEEEECDGLRIGEEDGVSWVLAMDIQVWIG